MPAFSPVHREVLRAWIGDTSAFPTPSGANPMLTCVALAHRTAEHILARLDEPTAAAEKPAA